MITLHWTTHTLQYLFNDFTVSLFLCRWLTLCSSYSDTLFLHTNNKTVIQKNYPVTQHLAHTMYHIRSTCTKLCGKSAPRRKVSRFMTAWYCDYLEPTMGIGTNFKVGGSNCVVDLWNRGSGLPRSFRVFHCNTDTFFIQWWFYLLITFR